MKKLIYLASLIFIAINANAQLPSYLPSNGLVAWYPFTGNANDLSGNNNNGTVYGATLTIDRFGSANSAYSFDGSSNFIHVTMNTPLNTTTISGLTISVWCKLNSITIPEGPLCFYDSTNSDLYGISFDETIQKFWGGNGVNGFAATTFINSINAIDTGVWYNVIFTCDYSSNISKLYLNSVFQNQSDSTLNRPILSGLNIGRWFPGGSGWFTDGKLDDIGIWNRALTQQEVTQLYNGSNCTSADITTGLVASYPFSGNANDVSGNNLNGTVNGATLTTDRFGNANSAYSFNGTSDYISVLDNNLLDFTNQFSISVWVNIPDYSLNTTGLEERVVIGKQRASNGTGFSTEAVSADNPGKYTFGINNNTLQVVVASTDSLSLSNWHHIVGVYDGQLITLYKDTKLINTAPYSQTLINSTEPLCIGKEGALNRFFKGEIDDVRLYNRPLTTCDVDSLYHFKGSITTGLSNKATSESNVSVFPNPSPGSFNIQIIVSQTEKAELCVTDIIGRAVSSQAINLNRGVNTQLINTLASGTYFISLKTIEGTETKKVVVIK